MFDPEASGKVEHDDATSKRVVFAGLLAAATVLLVVTAIVLIQRESGDSALLTTITAPDNTPALRAPTTTTPHDNTVAEIAPTPIAIGWVPFVVGDRDADIYLVGDGSVAHRIAGSDGDGVEETCPTFSPDGTRLAYGQATRIDGDTYQDISFHDVGLVIADVTAPGVVSEATTIALDGMPPTTTNAGRPRARPPCAIWSADGRWLAFGAGDGLITNDGPVTVFPRPAEITRQLLAADEVVVVDTQSDDLRRLPGTSITDIDWAPEANELYLADDGAISVYSVATDQTRLLADNSWDVTNLAVSPDGKTMAVQGLKADEEESIVRQAWASLDLRLMDIVGSGDEKGLLDRGVIAMDFEANHGIGPVWSPDGRFIAFQRVCGYTPDNKTCLEEHEVVVVTVNDDGPPSSAKTPVMLDTEQVVIRPPVATTPDGTTLYWYPYTVNWSSDSATLLYNAWGFISGGPEGEANVLLAVPTNSSTPPVIVNDARPGGYAFPPVPFVSG